MLHASLYLSSYYCLCMSATVTCWLAYTYIYCDYYTFWSYRLQKYKRVVSSSTISSDIDVTILLIIVFFILCIILFFRHIPSNGTTVSFSGFIEKL